VPRMDEPALRAGSAQEQLRTFVHTVLKRFFDEGRPAWMGKLVAHEMIEPTKALDMLVKQNFRPNFERLTAIIRELLDREVDEETLRLCTFSVAGQWLFYFHGGQVIKRLHPEQRFGPQDIEKLANHITKFSVAALKGWKT